MAEEVITVTTSDLIRIFTVWGERLESGEVAPTWDVAENVQQLLAIHHELEGK